ncbi:MAG TPA: hypothetical protein VLN26_10145 [Gaiellaceae bacterium]|nr:hypothetical protein [Gaiellaceae bacterium]
MNGRLTAAAVAIAAAALLAAGCGSSSSTTTSASGTVDWANSLCSATNTWRQALKDTAASLKDGPYTSAGLQDAAAQVKAATQDYVTALEDLGKPDTQAGQDAKAAVDRLRTQLESGADTMQKATEDVSGASGVLNAVSVVSGALVTMGDQVQSTVANLKQLDAKGELERAFSQADACATPAA